MHMHECCGWTFLHALSSFIKQGALSVDIYVIVWFMYKYLCCLYETRFKFQIIKAIIFIFKQIAADDTNTCSCYFLNAKPGNYILLLSVEKKAIGYNTVTHS